MPEEPEVKERELRCAQCVHQRRSDDHSANDLTHMKCMTLMFSFCLGLGALACGVDRHTDRHATLDHILKMCTRR